MFFVFLHSKTDTFETELSVHRQCTYDIYRCYEISCKKCNSRWFNRGSNGVTVNSKCIFDAESVCKFSDLIKTTLTKLLSLRYRSEFALKCRNATGVPEYIRNSREISVNKVICVPVSGNVTSVLQLTLPILQEKGAVPYKVKHQYSFWLYFLHSCISLSLGSDVFTTKKAEWMSALSMSLDGM